MRAAAKQSTPKPWALPPLTDAEIFSVKALADGRAAAAQQHLVWTFIREKLCQCELMSFWPGGEDGRRATDFAEGKRWVAAQLRRIARLQPATIDPRGEPPPLPPPDDGRQTGED